MSDDAGPGTLGAITRLLVNSLRPLSEAFADPDEFRALMLALGWDAPGLPPSYLTVADATTALVARLDALPDDAAVTEQLGVLAAAGDVFRAVGELNEAPAGLDPGTFLPALAGRLSEYLLVEALREQVPRVHATLELLGVITTTAHPSEGTRPPFVQVHLDWAAIPARLSDPASIPRQLWGYGSADLDLRPVFEVLGELAQALGLISILQRLSASEAALIRSGAAAAPVRAARSALFLVLAEPEIGDDTALLGVQLAELPAEGSALPGVALRPVVPSGLTTRIDLGDGWALVVRAGTDAAERFAVILRPDGLAVRYPGEPGRALPEAGFGVALESDRGGPSVLFGRPGETRLEASGARFAVDLDLRGGELDLAAAVEARGLALVVSAGGLDGFLGSLLGADGLRVDLPFAFGWSSRRGFVLSTAAGFEVTVHPDVDLGFLRIDRLDLALHLNAGGPGPAALVLRAAAGLSGDLGPFSYVIDRLGLELPVAFAPGNAGPIDVTLRPAWPTGLGLAIDTPAVRGGGFLRLDPEAGRYAGVFELTIVGTVSVKVIGLLTTKLPDGRDGFALLLIITADGFAAIQLGMGFVLTGIGGLIALNRTIDVEAVRGGLSSGVLDSVLFAKEPVKNAERLLSTLDQIFPLANDRLLVGPLVEIGWGSPTIVKIRLALLLELPQPLRAVLLAALAVVLPTPEQAVVEIHVDAIGLLDFGRGELSLDASLHHSRLWKFTLTGDMALRLNWGSAPQFLMSVGGFHPRYTPPAGLRKLERLTFSLSDSENPKVRFETYTALTSNTIQLGARVAVRAEAGGFGVDGGGAFDALVQWDPFGLDVMFEAWVQIFTPFGPLLAARLKLEVTGPQPWHVVGVVSLQVLWFSVEAGVDFTVGDALEPVPATTVDVIEALMTEIARPESWSAALPDGVAPGATLGAPPGRAPEESDEDEPTVVHPLAVIAVRQKVVPLDHLVTRIGIARPAAGARRYVLDPNPGTGAALVGTELREQFAVAQFSDMTEDEKLGSSFSSLQAGIAFGPAAGGVPLAHVVATDLELLTLDVVSLDEPALPGETVPVPDALVGAAPDTVRTATAGLVVTPR